MRRGPHRHAYWPRWLSFRVLGGESDIFAPAERIAPEWWRQLFVASDPRERETQDGRDGIAVGHPRWRTRDYYRIEDAHGAQYWVYRAGLYGADDEADGSGGTLCNREPSAAREMPVWFLQGMF